MSAVKKLPRRLGGSPYLSLFRIRLQNGLQYRTAAAAGIVTQFFWGGMEILIFAAFYQGSPDSFPMQMQAVSSYIWLQQAFLMLFEGWGIEWDILNMITSGNVAYELCRPVKLYAMWYSRSAASRLSKAALRCFPVLLVASLLPAPYGLSLPQGPQAYLWFLPAMLLGFLLNVSHTMLIYILSFFTIDSRGIRMFALPFHEFLSGAVVPLPFLPGPVRAVAEWLPYAGMQNLPLRIYSGDIAGMALYRGMLLQLIWLVIFVALGRWLLHKGLQRTVIQGG